MTFTRDQIRDKVTKYVDKNLTSKLPVLSMSADVVNHVINTATSIYCTKHSIGFEGGGFVKAVVDNDLRMAFARADDINRQALHFYVMFNDCFSPYDM